MEIKIKNSKKVISFAGKGGVGKTTNLALFLKYLSEENPNKDVLVIDSDPDANIADVTQVEVCFSDTLGGRMKVLKDKIQKQKLSPTVPKTQVIEGDVYRCLIEMEEFDLLEMGRQEGEGCYCFINSVLKNVMDTLSKNYDVTILDSPAGLEHFARKTGRDVTDLIIVTDPSRMGIHTMERILEIIDELSLKFKRYWILGNRFPEDLKYILEEKVEELKTQYNRLELLGFVPEDAEISEFNLTGKNLLELPDSNPVYQKVKQIFPKLMQ
ncbi:MAG: AAA family ATPase [Promethearchaeia archaeon]